MPYMNVSGRRPWPQQAPKPATTALQAGVGGERDA